MATSLEKWAEGINEALSSKKSELEANNYVLKSETLKEIEYIYKEGASLEYIVDTIRLAFMTGWDEANKK